MSAPSVLGHAMAMASWGWHVFPVDHPELPVCVGVSTKDHPADCKRGKCPDGHWPTRSSANPAAVLEMFSGAPRNIGIDCGKSSLVVADEDVPDLLAEHAASIGETVPATFTVRTGRPSGGSHYVYRRPAGVEIGCTRGTLPKGIDIRGAGGYIVGPGSLHASGAVYEPHNWHAPTAEAPLWLVKAVTTPAVAAPVAVDGELLDGPLPEWLTDRLAEEVPDKGRSDRFHHIVCAMCESGSFTQGQAVTVMAPWCAEHGKYVGKVPAEVARSWSKANPEPDWWQKMGAKSVAARNTAESALNAELPPTSNSAVTADSADQNREPEPAEAASWDEPIPLAVRSSRPPFPVGVYPPWLADMVHNLATFTQTDPAMVGAVALSVLAACAGGRLEVQVRPGWREPTNLFLAVVAAPGERKSPVQVALVAPLRAAEAALTEAARPVIAEAETLRDIAVRTADRAKAQAAREDGQQAHKGKVDAVAAFMAVEAITVPTMPRLLADDATPEALASLMAANAGRIAVISDEGGIFDILGGRYSSAPNLDPLLKGHAGTPMRVDRKGRPPEHIAKPALTIGVMVQPAVLRQAGANQVFTGRGLIARFLFVLPHSYVGRRDVNPPSVPEVVTEAYTEKIQQLATTLAGWTDPAVVTLTEAAHKVVVSAAQKIEDEMAPGRSLAHVADWANKMTGATIRIAGLLHVAWHPTDAWSDRPIGASVMADAVKLAECFAGHHQAAVAVIGADPVVEDATYVLGVISRLPTSQPFGDTGGRVKVVSVRDIFNHSRARFRKVGDLLPALTLLQDHLWVRRRPEPTRVGPGRPPSPTYEVNPLTDTAISAQNAELPRTANSASSADSAYLD